MLNVLQDTTYRLHLGECVADTIIMFNRRIVVATVQGSQQGPESHGCSVTQQPCAHFTLARR
jgi:hypothetical protein